MKALLVVAFFGSIMAWHLAQSVPAEQSHRQKLKAEVQTAHFLAYRQAVIDYLNEHGREDGVVSDADLIDHLVAGTSLDLSDWSNVVEDHRLYVSSNGAALPGAARRIYERMSGSLLVGVAQDGKLISPSGQALDIAVPAGISNDSLVIAGS